MVVFDEYGPQEFLQLHARIATRHQRLDDNRGAQITLKQLSKAIDCGLAVPQPLGLHALDRQESVRRIIGQRRANAVAPVPTTAHSTRFSNVIATNHPFSGNILS